MLRRWRALVGSSIGKKALMSLTGLMLVGYLIVHLAGNLLLFADDTGEKFDAYAHSIEENPLLPVAEIALLLLFVTHIVFGLRTALANREARRLRYKEFESHGNRSVAATTMIVTGLVVLVFLIVHVLDFRIAERAPDGLAAMVVRRLAGPTGVSIYLVGVAALGLHLWHAFQSAFQTLGVNHSRYTPLIKKAGFGLSVVLGLGFAAFPVVLFLAPRPAPATARSAPAVELLSDGESASSPTPARTPASGEEDR